MIEADNEKNLLIAAMAHFDAEHSNGARSSGQDTATNLHRTQRTTQRLTNLPSQGSRRKERVGKVAIRLDLEGHLAQKFILVKRKRGLKNNSELVRELISEAYQTAQGNP